MRKNPAHMPTFIKEQSQLALTYAEDGAYESAARVLEQLAEATRQHANKVTADMRAYLNARHDRDR